MFQDRAAPLHINALPMSGVVPDSLRGTHYRVGPVAGEAYGTPLAHAFGDADAYIAAYTFTDDGVSLHGEIVDTPVRRREQSAGRLVGSTFSTMAERSLPARAFANIRGMISMFIPSLIPWSSGYQSVKDTPNHVPCVVGDSLILLGGAGVPYALDLQTLALKGHEDFRGALPRRQLYLIGESHLDPNTGERCFLEINTGLRLWTVDANGVGRRSINLPMDHVYLPHDFGITPTKIVVPLGPIHSGFLPLTKATLGFATMNEVFGWHPDEPTRYCVIDRATWTTRMYEAPPAYPVHLANAFEDGDDLVLDMNVHSNDAGIRGFTASFHHNAGHPDFTNRLHRIRLSADGSCSSKELVPFDCEAPRSSKVLHGRPTRYLYAFATAAGIAGSGRVVKVDAETATHEMHDFGEHCVTGQPEFVPDPVGSGKEDEGWLLCQVYDSRADRTFLSILDATNIGNELARLDLPCPLPYLLHGEFLPARRP
jgi:carotenoid cleavage dioxygenase-like enzyme